MTFFIPINNVVSNVRAVEVAARRAETAVNLPNIALLPFGELTAFRKRSLIIVRPRHSINVKIDLNFSTIVCRECYIIA